MPSVDYDVNAKAARSEYSPAMMRSLVAGLDAEDANLPHQCSQPESSTSISAAAEAGKVEGV